MRYHHDLLFVTNMHLFVQLARSRQTTVVIVDALYCIVARIRPNESNTKIRRATRRNVTTLILRGHSWPLNLHSGFVSSYQ